MGIVRPPYYFTAYGLALKHGYRGTEEEWLASLAGTKMLTVHISGDSTQGYASDKSLTEILSANTDGLVRCVYGGRYLPLEYIDGDLAVFAAVNDEGNSRVVVEVDGQGAVRVGVFPLFGKDLYVVNLTLLNDNLYKTDKTLEQVLQVYQDGDRLIQCRVPAGDTTYILPLINASEAGVMYGGSYLGVVVTVLQTVVGASRYTKQCAQELVVSVDGSPEDGFESDLEFDEIRQEYDAGQGCVCLWGGLRLPLVSMTDELACFVAVVDGMEYRVEIGEEVKAFADSVGSSGGGSGGVYVGTQEPEDPDVTVWIDPSGGPVGPDPVAWQAGMDLAVGMDAEGRLYVDAYSKAAVDEALAAHIADVGAALDTHAANVDAALGAYITDVDALIGGEG